MTDTALLSLFGCILTANALQHQRVRPNGMAILPCGDVKEGKVTWSRYMNGNQVSILSTDAGQIIRHLKNNNHTVLPDMTLIIWSVSPLDEGLYYCNGMPVACLMVKPGAVSVLERVLMFSGVGLAALTFLMATVVALKKRQSVNKTDDKQTLQTEINYINLTSLH